MRLRTKRQSASIQGETPAYFQDYATLRRYLLGDSSGGRDILEQMMQEAVAENQGPTNDARKLAMRTMLLRNITMAH